ncbi:MAG: type I-B CRISPR-associated protein Cas8b1/Cst1 [Candidatus Kryptonium sp.]
MVKIYTLTGNPFVDAGIYVISELAGKRIEEIEPDDLERLYPGLVDLYFTNEWKRMLYSIFPNHPVTHTTGSRERYRDFLNGLFQDLKPLGSSGSCVACGRRDKTNVERKSGVGRDLVPLTGSADLVNFFPMGSLGLEICSACLLAIQFMPIFLHYCGGKFLLLHSNSEKVSRYWAKNCVTNYHKQITLNNFTGCYSSDFRDPVNSFFRSIEEIIIKYDENWIDEDVFIRFYYFSNYGQSPSVEIFDVPTPVFRFLAYVKQVNAYGDWKRMIDEASLNGKNEIYNKLLRNESIVRYFLSKDREIRGNRELLKFYLKEVREMDEKRINAIRELGDKIADVIRSLDSIKRLGQIEMAQSFSDFRSVLLRLERHDAVRVGLKEPLIRFDDYVFIFADGAKVWNEVRDLLLFRIYERLHDWLVERQVEEGTEE